MKYISSETRNIYDLNFSEHSPKKLYICPECSNGRKHSKDKDLQYYPDTNTAFCFHCRTTFFENKIHPKKEFKRPEWKNITKLTDKAVKWFTGRMISQNTLNLMQVYSDKEFMPQIGKEVETICFPYFIESQLINIKSRGPEKSFKLVSDAELNWYNFNIIKDNDEIIIVEGEIDVLTWIENGIHNVISVPNGAQNIDFIDIDIFIHVKKFYLAVDVDSPGLKLRDELVRRLGPERCNIVNFKQYKDSNEYLCGYGGIEFKKLLVESQPVPIKGIIEIESLYNDCFDLYQNGVIPGLYIGNPSIDEFVSWETSRLAVCSGVPLSGKSEFIDYLVCKLNIVHKWKAAFFTPENYPLKFHYRKLHEKLSGKQFDIKRNNTNYDQIFDYISSNFFYILNENDMTIDSILEAAKLLVRQKGIKILVIDPFNRVEHAYNSKEMNETKYIGLFLTKLNNFAKFFDVLVILVAHPRKMNKGDRPTLYDISGSANFRNQCDYGFIVDRLIGEDGLMVNSLQIIWEKVKFKHLGKPGISELNYNYNNGRYQSKSETVDIWDNSNWLDEKNDIMYDFKAGILPNEDFLERDELPF